jgi:hypothetical protein
MHACMASVKPDECNFHSCLAAEETLPVLHYVVLLRWHVRCIIARIYLQIILRLENRTQAEC